MENVEFIKGFCNIIVDNFNYSILYYNSKLYKNIYDNFVKTACEQTVA